MMSLLSVPPMREIRNTRRIARYPVSRARVSADAQSTVVRVADNHDQRVSGWERIAAEIQGYGHLAALTALAALSRISLCASQTGR